MSCDLFVKKINDMFEQLEKNLKTVNELTGKVDPSDISNLNIHKSISKAKSMQDSWNKIKPILCQAPCEIEEIVSTESDPRCKCTENIKTIFLETYNMLGLTKLNREIYDYAKENVYELAYTILTILKAIETKFNNMPQNLKTELENITNTVDLDNSNNVNMNGITTPNTEPTSIPITHNTSSTSNTSNTSNKGNNSTNNIDKYKFVVENLKYFPDYSEFDVLTNLKRMISNGVFYYLNEHNYNFIMKYLNKLSIIDAEITKIKNDISINEEMQTFILGKLNFFKSINTFIVDLVKLIRIVTKYTNNDENILSLSCYVMKCPDPACKIETGFGFTDLPITTEQITKYISILDEYNSLVNIEISKISNIKSCEYKKCINDQVLNTNSCNCTNLNDIV